MYYTAFIGYNLYYTERVVIFTRYHRSFFIITEQVVYYIRKRERRTDVRFGTGFIPLSADGTAYDRFIHSIFGITGLYFTTLDERMCKQKVK